MSESAVGVDVAATRQKAGSAAMARTTAAPAGGGTVKAPADTLAAEVTIAFGKRNDARLSHDAGAAIAGSCRGAQSMRTRHTPAERATFIGSPREMAAQILAHPIDARQSPLSGRGRRSTRTGSSPARNSARAARGRGGGAEVLVPPHRPDR